MHRAPVLQLLQQYRPYAQAGVETASLEAIECFVRAHADCFERSCLEGHLTGSAWITDRAGTRALLTHHRKLDKWLQLGGHADGETDLLAVALKEAREESGLDGFHVVSPQVFDIDRHWIPERKGVPGHWHLDLRFHLLADPKAPLIRNEESKELAWVDLDSIAALNPEESLVRMCQKTCVWRLSQT